MKALKIIGKIFAILFSIIYFLAFSLLMTIAFVTNLLSGDYYASVLKNVDLDTIKISECGKLFDSAAVDKDATVEETLISVFTKSGIEEKTAIAIIDNKEIREIIGNFIGDYVNYKAGGDEPEIKRSDVDKVLTNPDVVKAIGKTPSKEDIDKVYIQLNDFAKEIVEGGANNGNSERNNINIIKIK